MTSPSNRESPSSREIKSCRSPKRRYKLHLRKELREQGPPGIMVLSHKPWDRRPSDASTDCYHGSSSSTRPCRPPRQEGYSRRLPAGRLSVARLSSDTSGDHPLVHHSGAARQYGCRARLALGRSHFHWGGVLPG